MMAVDAEATAIHTNALGDASVYPQRNVHHTCVAKLILIDCEGSNVVPMRVELAID